MPDRFMPDMITEHVMFLSGHIKRELKNITGGKPLLGRKVPAKELLDKWLSMTQEEKFAELQRLGPEKYMEKEMNMEKLKERSDKAFKSHYNIEGGI